MIDLNEKRQDIIAVATELFEKFVNMPKDVRPDDKERTGIQVLVWEPGTRNLVMVSVKEPSEAARFFAVEKAVRSETLNGASSGDSPDFDKMKFPGSISILLNDVPGSSDFMKIVASTSGLKPDEDVAVSAAVIAQIIEEPFVKVCDNVHLNEGRLPGWYFSTNESYFQFLFE